MSLMSWSEVRCFRVFACDRVIANRGSIPASQEFLFFSLSCPVSMDGVYLNIHLDVYGAHLSTGLSMNFAFFFFLQTPSSCSQERPHHP